MTPIAAPEPVSSSLLTRIAVGLSIAVHVAAVLWTLGYAGAGLYEPEPEAVPVSLVTPEDVAAATPPPMSQAPDPKPDLSPLELRPSTVQNSPPPKAQPPAPAAKLQPNAKPSAPAVAPAPAYAPPQPDISVKYQVDLGLQQLAEAIRQADAPRGNSDFDQTANEQADIDRSSIIAFRNRLKDCATLPATVAPDDKVVIVLRATFTRDAKLAAAPALIEASASAKGPALMKAAVDALQTCQPFTSLPADKYQEWRVLDLRFTPRDFGKG